MKISLRCGSAPALLPQSGDMCFVTEARVKQQQHIQLTSGRVAFAGGAEGHGEMVAQILVPGQVRLGIVEQLLRLLVLLPMVVRPAQRVGYSWVIRPQGVGSPC